MTCSFFLRTASLAILSLLELAPRPAGATVRLPALVGTHMVLQRDRPVPVWGWAAPGEAVRVTFRGKTYAAAPGPDGRWQATLPAQAAGGPFVLTVKGQNTIELTDVLVGDVWLASGQSNMQFNVKDPNPGGYQPVQNADQEIAAANFPHIRLLTVAQTVAYQPLPDATASGWQVCSPATIATFSAVAYFFGRDLHQQLNVPIGLVVSSWGGTPAEAWVSGEGLKMLPEFRLQVAGLAHSTGNLNDEILRYDARQLEFLRNARAYDKGYLPDGRTWAAPDFEARAWPQMVLPGVWETTPALSAYDGIVWFRKEVDLPAAAAGQPLTLSLGKIDDVDSTWLNGVLVGSTNGYNTPRTYQVPGRLVRAGRNVIAVRVVDTGGGGGIWGEAEALHITLGGSALPLAGPWSYQVGLKPEDHPVPPVPGGAQNAPTTLYNGMIAPLQPYAIKGVIWYQGESNVGRAAQYQALLPALMADWRTRWGYAFPFLFVQLANFNPALSQPAPSDWAALREAQAKTLAVPGTGMATTIDIGEANDIHPHNKQEVGRRLALAARHVAYGDNALVYSGPTYAGLTVAGNIVKLRFSQLGGGLAAKGSLLRGFAVAGADQQFHWATAEIKGSEVVVSSPEVPAPVAVRYDWADNPNGNLSNRAGLPAVPFRTDSWVR